MSKKKYSVLVTNDDGFESAGLKALVDALNDWAAVYVVAPTEQRSATSQQITFRRDLTVEEREMKHTVEAYAIDGSPADCVKWAIQHYEGLGLRFDYVFSGINMGNNTGAAVVYSGTVAATREASLSGYRAIALSVNSHEATHFDYICSMLKDLIKTADKLEPSTFLSVNAPNLPMSDIKGTMIVPGAEFAYGEKYVFDQTGDNTYRLHPEFSESKTDKYDCDWDVLQSGFVSITPITSESLDQEALLRLKGLANDETLCVFVDFQEKLIPAMRKSDKLEKNVIKFAKALRRLDMPMLVTEQYSRGLGVTIKALRDAMEDYELVDKMSFNCFEDKAFRKAIDGMTSRKVILCGIEAHICLQQTAEGFLNRGYEVIIPRDCCASRKKEDFETAMELLGRMGCRITTWESIVYEMLGTSTHPAFRKISEIVKGE